MSEHVTVTVSLPRELHERALRLIGTLERHHEDIAPKFLRGAALRTLDQMLADGLQAELNSAELDYHTRDGRLVLEDLVAERHPELFEDDDEG